MSGIWALARVLAAGVDAQVGPAFKATAARALRKAARGASRTPLLIAVCQVCSTLFHRLVVRRVREKACRQCLR